MSEEKIKAGDIVTINWADKSSMVNARMLHMPQKTGDWFQVKHKGKIIALNPLRTTLETIVKELT